MWAIDDASLSGQGDHPATCCFDFSSTKQFASCSTLARAHNRVKMMSARKPSALTCLRDCERALQIRCAFHSFRQNHARSTCSAILSARSKSRENGERAKTLKWQPLRALIIAQAGERAKTQRAHLFAVPNVCVINEQCFDFPSTKR